MALGSSEHRPEEQKEETFGSVTPHSKLFLAAFKIDHNFQPYMVSQSILKINPEASVIHIFLENIAANLTSFVLIADPQAPPLQRWLQVGAASR